MDDLWAPATPPTTFAVDRSGKSNAIRLALGDGTEMKPQDVFEKVGGAVYVVKSEKSLGSAVAISDRELLTNCHVVGKSTSVTLEREGAKFSAAVISADQDADRWQRHLAVSLRPRAASQYCTAIERTRHEAVT